VKQLFAFKGLAYNGVNANNKVLWNGGANVKLRIYEKATNFQHVSFALFKINPKFLAKYKLLSFFR